ncbi:MAG TPA: 50S ribosomal protein L24 [Saprospiraceae bacterium]|nr:50S ribosomal protein L24 [Saprospiraceae bacterium]
MAVKKNKAIKWKFKSGDKVEVITGKDKGAQGEILEVLRNKGKVIVDNVNMVKKHMKPTGENPGGIIDKNMPIDISNVMLVDPKTGEPTRVGRREENGRLVRYAKKSGETLD